MLHETIILHRHFKINHTYTFRKKLSALSLSFFYNFRKKTLPSGGKEMQTKKFILEAEFWKVIFLLREKLVENLDCKYARICFEPKGVGKL